MLLKRKRYKQVRVPGGYRLEHRLVMERHIGRPLLRTEHIHHINEDHLDNRIENLQIVSIAEHNAIHRKGKPLSSELKQKLSLAKLGVQKTTETRMRMRQSKLKFSVEQLRDILKQVESGVSKAKIAAAYGVARTTIQNVCRGRYYDLKSVL